MDENETALKRQMDKKEKALRRQMEVASKSFCIKASVFERLPTNIKKLSLDQSKFRAFLRYFSGEFTVFPMMKICSINVQKVFFP